MPICVALLVLVGSVVPGLASDPVFNDEAMLRIIATDQVRRHPVEARREAQVADAVRSLIGNTPNDVGLQRAMPDGLAWRKNLERTLTQEATQWEKYSAGQPSGASQSVVSGLGLSSSAGSVAALSAHPVVAAGGTVVAVGASATASGYAWLRGPVPAIPYRGTNEDAVESLVWAMKEARGRSVARPVMSASLGRVLHLDPTGQLAAHPAVREALTELRSIRAEGKSDEALMLNRDLKKEISNLKNGVDKVTEDLRLKKTAGAAADADARANLSYTLGESEGALLAGGNLLLAAGKEKPARLMLGLARVAHQTRDLVSSASTMGPSLLMGNYIGLATQLVGLLGSANEPASPYPAIFEMLQQLQRSLDQLRSEMKDSFEKLDARLGNLLEHSIMIDRAQSHDLFEIRTQLLRIQDQLARSSAEISSHTNALAEIHMTDDDMRCFRRDGERVPLPPEVDFIRCRDIYVERAVNVARGPLAGAAANVNAAPLEQMFPFAEHYNQLARTLNSPPNKSGRLLANPNAWLAASGRFVELMRRFPAHVRDIDMVSDQGRASSLTLDPMIEAGEEIKSFVNATALTGSGDHRVLNEAMFNNLIDQSFAAYEDVIGKVEKELQFSGVNADVTKDSSQSPPAGYDYRFLKGTSVTYCEGAKPRLQNMTTFQQAFAERKHGYAVTLDSRWRWWPHAEKHIDAVLGDTPIARLQPGAALVQAIDPSILNLERIIPEHYEIKPCLKSFVIDNLTVNGATNTYEADLSATLEISVLRDRAELFRVQTLHLPATHAKIPLFSLIVVKAIQSHELAEQFWNTLKPALGTSKPILAGETSGQLQRVKREVDHVLISRRSQIAALAATPEANSQVETLRRQMLMIAGIGLNRNLASVDAFLRRVSSGSSTLPSVEELIKSMVTNGGGVEAERRKLAASKELLQQNLRSMAEESDLAPPTDLIEMRLAELNRLRTLRSMHLNQ